MTTPFKLLENADNARIAKFTADTWQEHLLDPLVIRMLHLAYPSLLRLVLLHLFEPQEPTLGKVEGYKLPYTPVAP